MSSQKSRREFLHVGAAGVSLVISGCSSRGNSSTETMSRSQPTTINWNEPTNTSGSDVTPLDIEGSFPSYQFDDGNTGYGPAVTGVPEDGTQYWHLPNGGNPVVENQTLYMCERPGDAPRLVARRAATGKKQWSSPLRTGTPELWLASTKSMVVIATFSQVAAFDSNDGTKRWDVDPGRVPVSIPTISGDTVYFAKAPHQENGTVCALDLGDGTERWCHELAGGLGDAGSSVTVSDGTVYMGSGNFVTAIDAASGSEIWQTEVGDRVYPYLACANGSVYAVDASGTIYALSGSDGVKRWHVTKTPPGAGTGVFAISDSLLYFGGKDGIYALNPEDGSQKWVKELPHVATPATTDETVYVGTKLDDNQFYALDAMTGDVRWQYLFPQITDGDVIDTGVSTAPAIVDGGVYVRAIDGLYAFGPQN